jgi:hypothetical protein
MKNTCSPNAISLVTQFFETNRQRRRAIVFLFATVLLSVNSALSQKAKWPFELWHHGEVVLVNGDTLTGLVKYNLAKNIVEFGKGDTRRPDIFIAARVVSFKVQDVSSNRIRKFFTLPYAVSSNYETMVFFELLVDGEITILSREFLRMIAASPTPAYPEAARTVLGYKFFLLDNAGIVEIDDLEKKLIGYFGEKAKQVEDYVRDEQLTFEKDGDVQKIISFYNSL